MQKITNVLSKKIFSTPNLDHLFVDFINKTIIANVLYKKSLPENNKKFESIAYKIGNSYITIKSSRLIGYSCSENR